MIVSRGEAEFLWKPPIKNGTWLCASGLANAPHEDSAAKVHSIVLDDYGTRKGVHRAITEAVEQGKARLKRYVGRAPPWTYDGISEFHDWEGLAGRCWKCGKYSPIPSTRNRGKVEDEVKAPILSSVQILSGVGHQ